MSLTHRPLSLPPPPHSISASTFAGKHGIATSYGSYAELYADPNVDVIYVGNVHVFRREVGEAALLAGKHVVLEKPFACTAKDAKYLVDLAKERNLFVMEGMWTRFFPAVQKARDVLATGIIGDVTLVASDFNFCASDSDEYPTSFIYNRKLGGSGTYLTGPYPIAAALACFGGTMPDKVTAVGIADELTEVDLQACINLSFPNTSDSGNEAKKDENPAKPTMTALGSASITCGVLTESKEETVITGTKGRVTIETPCHCPTTVTVEQKLEGRGKVLKETFVYPLPDQPDEITEAGGFYYPNSIGFAYEAAAVSRCIQQGLKEAPQITHTETIACASIIDETRKQIGVKGIFEE